jgi:hypothetical protein
MITCGGVEVEVVRVECCTKGIFGLTGDLSVGEHAANSVSLGRR